MNPPENESPALIFLQQFIMFSNCNPFIIIIIIIIIQKQITTVKFAFQNFGDVISTQWCRVHHRLVRTFEQKRRCQ